MRKLEKILEEIEQYISEWEADPKDGYASGFIKGLKKSEKIIRKHMNDGWIPVDEQLPEVDADIEETIEDDDCPEYNVTIRGALESTTLKYNPSGAWFDDNGNVYDVIAWRPLPEPYRPERSRE